MRLVDLPGEPAIGLEHLVLDVNGTITHRGALIEGVRERIRLVATDLSIHLLSADTFGTADAVAKELGVSLRRVGSGSEKAEIVESLGADATVAIGNGRNDVEMLRSARLGLVIIGPEGAASEAIAAAAIVCGSITDALDLLLDERLLIATLRR